MFTWIVEHRAGALDPVFVALSVVGFAGLLWIALAPLVALFAGVPVLRLAAATAATVWSADLVALGIKAAVGRPRPFESIPEAHPLIGGTLGSSFPSGHAATSFAAAVLLASVAPRLAPVLLALAAATAFSRVYAGVHYPSDVLAGALLGSLVGGAAAFALRALPSPAGARPRSLRGQRRG